MKIFIWYPKCSTCQKAYKSLQEKNISVELRDIVKETPTKEELEKWQEQSGVELKKFFNTSGLVYKNLQLKEKLYAMTKEEQRTLLSENGMLNKRPLLITEDKIIIGYKEEEYKSLLK